MPYTNTQLCHGSGKAPLTAVSRHLSPLLALLTFSPRCVQRYLCIGEAPDLSAQAFQQRSRWSKGHFQTFYSSECPLFDQRLNLFFRLAYSSTCVGYLSTGARSLLVLNLTSEVKVVHCVLHSLVQG